MPYTGVSTPFKGVRVYTTAAMGMPGSEVALQELTALLFGDLRRQGKVEALMDDIYIGANTEQELVDNWRMFLRICFEADIRLNPKKVIIAPRQTNILGWVWTQGGILEIDPHASNRLQQCSPPTTAEGLRGWIGAYKFMSTAIPDYAKILEPLHQAVGDRSKKDAIEWSEELKAAFKRAQESLKTAQPLTMP